MVSVVQLIFRYDETAVMSTPFGERLRRLRKNKGLTMDKLAQAAGISKSYVWELENRPAQRPSATVLQSISAALGVTMLDLLGETPPVEGGDAPEDLAFFREYLGMSESDKDRYRKMLKLFKNQE
jgi:transcriptional regulator with XRE-family HTH domain